MKKQVKFTGWLYECEIVKVFQWTKDGFLYYNSDIPIEKRKGDFLVASCNCGKNCKPVKVELILKVVK